MALIAILFTNDQNRELFAEWITEYTDHTPVPVADPPTLPEEPFDLCLVDGYVLRKQTEVLAAVQEAAAPQFLPILLMIDRQRGQRLSGDIWTQVDDIIWRDPGDLSMEHSRQFRFEIRGRIGNLLDRRWLSVNLDRRRRLTLVLQRILRHNLRNDLNVVRGFADQLHREADNEVAERIVTKTDRLIALAEKARELEGIVTDRQARTETDLADLLGQVVEHLRELHPDVGFSLDCSDLDNPVSLRPSFERALQELLENAAKHGTGRHGIDVSARQSASTTTVEIRDDGPGLSDAERRILESGVEGNLSHGQGLGHWLVYWVVTNHDGTITTDVTDQGTTISVTVPTTPSDRE